MNLKILGYVLFAIVCTVIVIWLFFDKKKRDKIKNSLPPFLEEQRDKAEELFKEINDKKIEKYLEFCDGKAYKYEWFNKYEWKIFSDLKSQYDSFIMVILNTEDDSILPVYYSKQEYRNIYLFMKEIIYSISSRINDANTKNIYEDCYLLISEYIIFHKIKLDDIIFLPIKNDIDDSLLSEQTFTFGFNNVEKARNPFELAYRKLNVNNDLSNLNWNFDKFIDRSYFNLLKNIVDISIKEPIDEKSLLVIWLDNNKLDFRKNFKTPIVILNENDYLKYSEEKNNWNEIIKKISFEEEIANPLLNMRAFQKQFGGKIKWTFLDSKSSLAKKIIKSKSSLIRTLRV